jgi:hypothetical protein
MPKTRNMKFIKKIVIASDTVEALEEFRSRFALVFLIYGAK